MSTQNKTAKILSVLFLTAIFTSVTGSIGFIEPVTKSSDILIALQQNQTKFIFGIILQLICAVAVVFIGIVLFPVLKRYHRQIAYGYFGFRVIESAMIFASAVSLFLLITIGLEMQGNPGNENIGHVLSTLAVAGHFWAFKMVIITCAVAGTMLCYVLYRSKLIPRFISCLGLLGYPLSFLAAIVDMFGIMDTLNGPGFVLYIPGSLFEIVLLPIWLFFKGFNQKH